MAQKTTNAVRDLLLGDDAQQQAEFILNLISEAAEGREVLNVISDVIQVTIAGGVGHPHIKKLAYDLCKAVPLLDTDYGLVLDGIKNDVSSGMAEVQVMALSFLPHVPPQVLVDLLEKGEVASLVVPLTRSITPSVRAAATACLGALLLQPDIQAALAASPALVATNDEWWDAVTDGLADSMADVILASLAATNKLFDAAASASHGAVAMRTSARRTALRVCLVMGPLVDTWRMLPSHAQVSVASLMGHIASAVAELDPSQAAQAGNGFDTAGMGGSLSAALAGVISYLATALQSLNPAVKLEAARVLLRMSSAGRRLPPLSAVRLADSVPPAVAASAISALLELKERLLVEAALAEVISLVAGHLDVLPVTTRVDVLRRLWPMIALLQSPTDRMTAFAASWRTALDLHLQASEAAAKGVGSLDGLLLPALLADTFIQDVLNQKAQPPIPAPGDGPVGPGMPGLQSGDTAGTNGSGGGTSPGGSGGRPGGQSVADTWQNPVAAGATGASTFNPVSAGATGASTISTVTSVGGNTTTATVMGLGSLEGSVPSTPRAGSSSGLLAGAAVTAADLVKSAGISLPRFLDAPVPIVRGQLPASLKQELVCALLGVLAQHPSSGLALQLPPGEPVELPPLGEDAAGEPKSDKPPVSSSQGEQLQQQVQNGSASLRFSGGFSTPQEQQPPSSPRNSQQSQLLASVLPPALQPLHPNAAAHGELQERAVLWLDAAVAALQATGCCLQWEPLLPPPLPGQPPTPKLPAMQAVNLTTVPVDLWLQLLQGTCAASRAILRAHGHTGLKSIYRANSGRMLPCLTVFDVTGMLARMLEGASISLQTMIQRSLNGWRTLALAARPRVLWVAAHYLELPAMLEETWSCLLGCVEDTLLRVWKMEGDAHARLLAASAREGVLFKRVTLPQLGANAGKRAQQTLFDAAAASALVELPEYRADGLQVALCVLQYLSWVVQANTRQKEAGAPSGPAEAALAKRLLEIVKAAGAAEATGVDLKEWCRRISRSLSAVDQETTAYGQGQAPGGVGGPAFSMPQPPTQAKGALPGGYNPVAGFNALGFGGGGSSSDDDSDVGSSSSDPSERRQSGSSSGEHDGIDSSSSSSSSVSSDDSSGDSDAEPHNTHHHHGSKEGAQSPHTEAKAKRVAAKQKEKDEVARRNLLVGAPEASSGAWGYPFTGPRARTLFISRRNRRHRLMRWHLATAMAANNGDGNCDQKGDALTMAEAGSTDDTGPVFSAGSGFRLDKRAFWDSLLPGSGAISGWQELTGPNDPIMLSGCYTLAKQGGAELLVTLRAYNRLSLDVEDVEVAVRLVGPVRPERREVSWVLPRLLPTEAATHQFKLLPTGYGRVELHARLVLPVGGEASVPALRCRPLAISMARMLRVPRGLVPGPHGFLEAWSGLPVSAELPVVATWPGVDGLLLTLSALARQPLRCAWQRALPAVCGAQAAYLSAPAAEPNESLALVVTLQLLPPAKWDAQRGVDQQQEHESDKHGSDTWGVDGAQDGDGNSTSRSSSSSSKLDATKPSPVEAVRQLCSEMRAVGHVQLRSSSHEVILAVRDHSAAWVDDLAQGTLALGLTPPNVAPSDKPLLHPSVARLQRCFEAAPLAMPFPEQVPYPELPPLPKFQQRLKDKKQEEDSDAEDEALPLTEDEKAQQQKELDKHKDDCRQVQQKHRDALGARASAVLHRAALAEWKRLAAGVDLM